MKYRSVSGLRLLAGAVQAGLARSAAGELTLVLTALLALRTRLVMAGQGVRTGVVRIVLTASASAPHPGLHPSQEKVEGRGLLYGPGLVERPPPHTVVDGARGGVGGRPVQVDNVTLGGLAWLAGGILLQGENVGLQEPFVNAELCFVVGYIHQVSEVSRKYSLEDVGVQITGVVPVTGIHQNTLHCHSPASIS